MRKMLTLIIGSTLVVTAYAESTELQRFGHASSETRPTTSPHASEMQGSGDGKFTEMQWDGLDMKKIRDNQQREFLQRKRKERL